MPHAPLDIFFRAQRYYIQGSLLVPVALRTVARLASDRRFDGAIIQSVNFHSIIDHACTVGWDEGDDFAAGAEKAIITTSDPDGSSPRTLRLYRNDQDSGQPPRRSDTERLVGEVRLDGEGHGWASLDIGDQCDPLEAFLRGMVEFNKSLYELRYPGCRDIIFAGLFASSVPASAIGLEPAGKLEFRQLSQRRGMRRTSAISETRFLGNQDSTFSASVIFSFVEDRG